MSDPDRDKHLSRSGVGDGAEDTREDEAKDSDDFFNAGDVAAISDWLPLRAASESGQSGGGTDDDPIGPVTPSAAPTKASHTILKTPPPSIFRIQSQWTLDDDEVDPMPLPVTLLEPALPAFLPPMVAKAKSSISVKSLKSREASPNLPFPSSAAEGPLGAHPPPAGPVAGRTQKVRKAGE
jgi:hypothetical protein